MSHGLQDNSDDVRAVAAEALLPLTEALAAKPPGELQRILWDILLEVEELSPSTGQLTCLPVPELSHRRLADIMSTLCDNSALWSPRHVVVQANGHHTSFQHNAPLYPVFKHTLGEYQGMLLYMQPVINPHSC